MGASCSSAPSLNGRTSARRCPRVTSSVKADRSDAFVHGEQWYSDNAVELVLNHRVTALDRAAHEVELDTGKRIGYTKLLLATGASPRRLEVPGSGPGLDGMHSLRTLEEADELRDAISSGGRVVVVGGGWIGLEVAAAAREYGCEVVVVEPSPTPLHGALGPEIGEFFGELHRRHGVDVRVGRSVTAVRGNGRVSGVVTDDGAEISADVVVVGVGARPNTELAEQAGLTVDGGVVVDGSLRTDDPDVYAAGDAANSFNSLYGRHIRVEHWANALNGAPVAAKAMLGQRVHYAELPFFFSDQYDVGMEFSGWFAPGRYDRVIIRGDVRTQAFHAFWFAGDRVVAGLHVNRWEEGIAPVQELIRAGQPVNADRLSDTAVSLSALVSA